MEVDQVRGRVRANRRRGGLAAVCVALAMAASGLSGCEEDEDCAIEGRVFVSGITSSDGSAVGVAVDFIPTACAFSAGKVALEVYARGETFALASGDVAAACLELPAPRLNLFVTDGRLEASSRVRVLAYRVAEALDAAAPLSAECRGTILDDAIWPTRGAMVVPPPTGGSGGTGGDAGGTGGSAGAGGSAGTSGGAAGAGGQGGVAGSGEPPDAGSDGSSDAG